MSRRNLLWKGTSRRFLRKVKRSYKDVKRQPLGTSHYLQSSIEHHHEIHGDAPKYTNLNEDGATGWAVVLQPWYEFSFNKSVIEPQHGASGVGPIRSNKIHQRRWNVKLTMTPRFHMKPSGGPPDGSLMANTVMASVSLSWRVRVVFYSYKGNAFNTSITGGTPMPEDEKAAHIIQLIPAGPPAPTGQGKPAIFNWTDFVGLASSIFPTMNMHPRYNSSHDGTYHIWSDRVYSFTGTKQRVLNKTFGPRIIDFDHVSEEFVRMRSPRLCVLVIYDVAYPGHSDFGPEPDQNIIPYCSFFTVMETGLNYSLL